MNILRATPDMLGEILALENEAFTCPWSEQSFREAFASNNIAIYAALSDDRILYGFACLMIIESEAELLNIAVSKAFRRQGIANGLMNYLLAEAEQKNVTDIFLEVRFSNIAAQNLYTKHGFVTLGIRKKYYTNPVEDAILMRKTRTIIPDN